MGTYSEPKSQPMDLNKIDGKNILKDALYFLIVPATFYISAVLSQIQLPGHIIALHDFIPNNATCVAILVHLGNTALNALRKYIF